MKDHETLKTGLIAVENSALPHREKLRKTIKIENTFKIVILFHSVPVFAALLIK